MRSEIKQGDTQIVSASDVASALERLIPVERCVLSFDKSLVELLPEILKEQYEIPPADEEKLADLSLIKKFFKAKTSGDVSIVDLPRLLAEGGFDVARYKPLLATDGLPDEFQNWSAATATEDLDRALVLQKDLGRGAHNAAKAPYDPNDRGGADLRIYLRSVTTARPSIIERLVGLSFWELKIKLWRLRGFISATNPSLSVGPRWTTEVRFFREIVGLQKHIGLDLSSSDPVLVETGDMHNMPLKSGTYDFIFVKNTADKSYDIRKFVSELVRVAAPNGIIAIDQICGHGAVSPIHRTDIQKAENLFRLFKAHAKVKPLVCRNIDIRRFSRDGSTNNARLAVQVIK